MTRQYHNHTQSELPQPIPRNSMESDHGCTSRIYFDNADDNVTLTLYNVMLTSHNSCEHNNKCDCNKTNGFNEIYVFSIKYRYGDTLLKKKTETSFILLIELFE